MPGQNRDPKLIAAACARKIGSDPVPRNLFQLRLLNFASEIDVPCGRLATSEKQLVEAQIGQRFPTWAFGGHGHWFAGYPRRRPGQIAEQ